MAVVVARMLDRVGVLKANGKVITAQDIANLESLTIEFADELALLNVKVSTLEDTVAGLKKDVDLIKADLRGVGARAGITGTMQARFVFTSDGSNGWAPGNFVTGQVPNAAASTAIGRYKGGSTGLAVNNAFLANSVTNPYRFDSRQFFSVSNFAVNIDREFDPKFHFHAQVDINAEGAWDQMGARSVFGGFSPTWAGSTFAIGGNPLSGRGENFAFANGSVLDALVNEVYVVWDDWFTDGVSGRLGIWALPMNTEVNGPSRSYQWTITPSIANSKWESLRPVGLDIFQHNDKESLVFYVGFFTPGDTTQMIHRSGTLLSAPTGFTAVPVTTNLATNVFGTQVDPTVNPGGAAWGLGRFPTPLAYAAMTDAARGVQGQTLASDDIGFYFQIGTHPTNKGHEGLTWHVAYFDRNGDLRPATDDFISATDWYAWQLAANYQWEKVMLGIQYFDATSRNYNLADPVVDWRRQNTTPFLNVGGQDTQSRSIMAIVNWAFSKRGNVTVRYEAAEDKTGLAKLEADVWTFGFNWKTSDHSRFQLEWIAPTTKATSENGWRNTSDIKDDLVQLNYKLNW
ncbi:MAG: hypothetical protein HY815_11385 [Candidatus Riflebacteria bacterium]|nr:hypothetical protein [Candidatus Riflebacteria bacterium]